MLTQPEQPAPAVIENIEVEQALLGALMLDNDQIGKIAGQVSQDDFADPFNGQIFAAMLRRYQSGMPADPLTLKTEFGKAEVGEISGAEYLVRLVDSATTTKAKPYAKLINELSVRRRLVQASYEIQDIAAEPEPGLSIAKILEQAEERLADCRRAGRVNSWPMTMARALQKSLDRSAAAFKGNAPSGFQWFTKEIAGLTKGNMQPGRLYGIMANAGGGKSSLALQQLYFGAMQEDPKKRVPGLFLSCEQPEEDCSDQVHAQALNIEANDIRDGLLSEKDFDRLYDHAKQLESAPLAIHEVEEASVNDLSMRARAFVRQHGPGVIAVDHARLITPKNPRDMLADRVNQIYRDLKRLAMELDSAVIVLMQQNSESLKRSNPFPLRIDAYGGAGTVQNLDVLLTIWREAAWLEELLLQAQAKKDFERVTSLEAKIEKIKDKALVTCLKGRYGRSEKPKMLKFIERFTRFESVREQDPQERMAV